MRRFLTTVISLLVFFVLPFQTGLAAFSDVSAENPHAEAINTLSTLSIINGYPDGTFHPEQEVSRAEMLTLVMKSAGIVPDAGPQSRNFLDVADGAWYFQYVRKAMTARLITGYADNTFRPTKTVTLAEGLAMIFKGHGVQVRPVQSDTKTGLSEPWHIPYLEKSITLNLTSRNNPLTDPNKNLTRAEAAELIFRMKKISSDRLERFDITADWWTFRNEGNYYEIKYPSDWQAFKGTNHSALWKLDGEQAQAWFTHTYPKSAHLSISISGSTISLPVVRQRFSSLYGKDSSVFADFSRGSARGLIARSASAGVIDLYLNLGNGKALTWYGEYGSDPYAAFLEQEISAMMHSFTFVEKPAGPPPPTPEQKLTTLRERILVESKGRETMALFADRVLIETDSVGVGTGPVDYYYSAEIDHTIKYERASNVILSIKKGRTSAF
ncbi:MAG: S-layer homology domain-containing protein [Patescibacteria group bacterium]